MMIAAANYPVHLPCRGEILHNRPKAPFSAPLPSRTFLKASGFGTVLSNLALGSASPSFWVAQDGPAVSSPSSIPILHFALFNLHFAFSPPGTFSSVHPGNPVILSNSFLASWRFALSLFSCQLPLLPPLPPTPVPRSLTGTVVLSWYYRDTIMVLSWY